MFLDIFKKLSLEQNCFAKLVLDLMKNGFIRALNYFKKNLKLKTKKYDCGHFFLQ